MIVPSVNAALLAVSGSPAASILAKVTITTALALAAVRLARNSRAAVRHVVLASAFAVLFILPIASLVAPAIRVAVPVAAPPPAVALPADTGIDPVPAGLPAEAGPAVNLAAARWSWPSPSAIGLTVWAIAAAVFLLPVFVGLWQVRFLRRSSLAWKDGQATADVLAFEAGIRRRISVLLHQSTPGPMTCGLLRGTIVLPLDAPAWPDEDLRRALIHELEHVRRFDWLSQCVARTLCAFYWFHPLVWIAWRQLCLEAERACDDAVLRHASTVFGPVTDATAYADQLVVLAARLSAGSSRPHPAMANRADLATRVVAVLDSRQRRGRAGVRGVSLAIAGSMLLVTAISPLRLVSVSAASAAPADRAAQTPADARKFDVVSVKPCASPVPVPGGRSGGGGALGASPGQIHVDCMTLVEMVTRAYVQYGNPPPSNTQGLFTPEMIKGGPAWTRSDRYTIEAKAEGTPPTTVMMGAMLRSVLEDRFQLKMHQDSKEVPAYALTVAKGGLKLQPVPADTCELPDPNYIGPRTLGKDGFVRSVEGGKPLCTGGVGRHAGNDTYTVTGQSFDRVSRTLGGLILRHPVIDKTDTNGQFSFHVEYAHDESTPALPGPPAAEPSDVPAGASIFTVFEKELGLKLVPTKAQQGFFVIDTAERPSPNSATAGLEPRVQPNGPTPRFEVASIKPCKPGELPSTGRGGAGGPTASPGRLHIECVPLVGTYGLIRQAYGKFASGVHNAYLQESAVPVEGGPAWIRSERYTIDAKAEGTPSMEMMRGPMLQALLEDRFQLKVHRETREIPVYELTIAKGGPKLRPFDGRCTPVDFTKGNIPAQLEAQGSCPIALRGTSVDGPGQTIGDFIAFALVLLDRPVVDKTGLTGRFDIHLDLAPDDPSAAPDATSTVAVAIQQLGLKLVPAKGPGAFLVVDRVERPEK